MMGPARVDICKQAGRVCIRYVDRPLQKNPLGMMAPCLIQFCSAFILDETSNFVCRYVEPLRSYALPTDGGPRKLRFFPRQFLGVGEKKSKVGDHPCCVQILW